MLTKFWLFKEKANLSTYLVKTQKWDYGITVLLIQTMLRSFKNWNLLIVSNYQTQPLITPMIIRFSSNSKTDNKQRNKPDIDTQITPTLLNKIMEIIKNLYNTCIKSKYTKIIKYQTMISTVQKFEKIHANLWGPNNLPSILRKSYVSLLLNKYIRKLWILLLKSKNEFFDAFK